MLTDSDDQGLQDYSLQSADNGPKHDLDKLSQAQLLELHAQIEQRLPGLRLSEVNLVREALLQLHHAKALQAAAAADRSSPLNQRAQVQNSLSKVLQDLGKLQAEIYPSEMIKQYQGVLVRVIRTLPEEKRKEVLELLKQGAADVEKQLDEVVNVPPVPASE